MQRTAWSREELLSEHACARVHEAAYFDALDADGGAEAAA
jgi:hypothetical protein